MKFFRFLLLLCLPPFLLTPIPSYAYHIKSNHELFIPRDKNKLINPWGYFHPQTILTHLDRYADHVFGFIDLLTNVDFLESLSDEEAERLIDFVIFIVRFSVPKSRPDLAEKYELEITELLALMYEGENDGDEYLLSSIQGFHSDFVPYIFYEKPTFTFCKKKKSWVSRKWHHFAHWVDKNKAPIIAVSLVAGGAALAAITMGASAGAGVAIGGALAGLTADDTPPPHVNKPGEVYFRGDSLEPPPHPTHTLPPSDSSIFHYPQQNFATTPSELIADYETLAEEIELVKEQILEANTSFDASPENAKELARDFAAQQLKKSMELIVASIEENMEKPELKAAEFITSGGAGKTVSRIGAVASRVLGLTTRTTTGVGTAALRSTLLEGDSFNKNIDPRLPKNPDDLLNNPSWNEISHPKARELGHRTFENSETGERLRYDEGKPGKSGHEGRSHWHRYNPNSTCGKEDEYLDVNDNPVRRYSEESHLYSPTPEQPQEKK